MLATLRKNLSTSDLRFVQVIEVEKKGTVGKFFEAEAVGQKMKRPRLRNVPRGSLFSTEITWTNLKSDVDQIYSEESSQHNF